MYPYPLGRGLRNGIFVKESMKLTGNSHTGAQKTKNQKLDKYEKKMVSMIQTLPIFGILVCLLARNYSMLFPQKTHQTKKPSQNI